MLDLWHLELQEWWTKESQVSDWVPGKLPPYSDIHWKVAPPQCLPCSILQLQSGSPLLKGRCTQWMEIPPSVYLLSFESFAARDNWNCWNTGNTIRKSAQKLIFPLVRHGHNKTFKTGAEKQKDMEMCQEQLKLYLEQTRYLSCFLHLSLSNIKDKR